jgi:hypothetical protein
LKNLVCTLPRTGQAVFVGDGILSARLLMGFFSDFPGGGRKRQILVLCGARSLSPCQMGLLDAARFPEPETQIKTADLIEWIPVHPEIKDFNTGSLLRFAHKTLKNRLAAGFIYMARSGICAGN